MAIGNVITLLRILVFVSISWLAYQLLAPRMGQETHYTAVADQPNYESFYIVANQDQSVSGPAVILSWKDIEKFKISHPNYSFSKIPSSGEIPRHDKEAK